MSIKNDDIWDGFLDDTTHKIYELWQERGGRELTNNEMYEINDFLTAYFSVKRE